VIFDPDVRYGCVRCGKSCRHDWDIWIHRDLPARIRPHLDRLGIKPENAFVQVEERVRLARDERGCRFLEDSLCALHCHLGLAYKPDFCQQYPWFLIETPEGIRVSASYTCTAVLRGAGPPLMEQRAEIERCLALNPALDVSLRNWEFSRDFHARFELAVAREPWALCLLRCLTQARSGRNWDELDPGQGSIEDMEWARRLVVGALLKPCLDHEESLWLELDRALTDGGEVRVPQFGYIGSGAELLAWSGLPLNDEAELERYRRSVWFRRQHLRCEQPLAGLLLNWSAAPLYRVLARLSTGEEALERIEMTIGHGRGVERVFQLLAEALT
jgi:hypothetical protein